MKKINLLITVLLITIVSSCNTEEEKFFNDQPTIYFKISETQRDSILLSFAKTTAKEMIYEIPVEIAGYAATNQRKFKVAVDEKITTATVGTHYKALEAEYTIEPNAFTGKIPVTFYCTDATLDEKFVHLALRIVPTDDFGCGMADRQLCKLSVSNILLKPGSWDGWWSRYFGVYSKVKHKIILEQCNISEIPDSPEGNKRYRWQGYGNVVLNYCKENYPVYNENNQIIEPNWVVKY